MDTATVERATVDTVANMNPLTILQSYVSNQPPVDIRVAEGEVCTTDAPFLQGVVETMDLRVIDQDPQKNLVVFGIYILANALEYQRYLTTLAERESLSNEPHLVRDPLSGDPVEVRPPAPPEPTLPNKALHGLLTMSLEIEGDQFTLAFTVANTKKQILYHNVLQGGDIAYLSRRTIHEVFGNPFLCGGDGPYLEGITHLFQGNKVPLCKDNPKPNWMTGQIMRGNPKLAAIRAGQLFLRILSLGLIFLIPVWLLIVGIFSYTIRILRISSVPGSDTYLHLLSSGYLLRLAIVSTLIIVSLKLGLWCVRQIHSLNLKSQIL